MSLRTQANARGRIAAAPLVVVTPHGLVGI
jgi:hypothetical protein